MGFGSLKERTDGDEPNKSLHWSPEFPRIRYPSSTISFLFSDLYIVANFAWSSEALHNLTNMGFSKKNYEKAPFDYQEKRKEKKNGKSFLRP